jgi:hypothetical protein
MFPRIYSEAWQAKNIGVLEGFFSGAATTLNDRPKSASTEVFFRVDSSPPRPSEGLILLLSDCLPKTGSAPSAGLHLANV